MDPKFSTSKPSLNEKTGQSFDSFFTQNQFLGVKNRLPLPTFWPSDVKLWFASVEAVFQTYFVVSERERYNQLLAALKQDEIFSRVGHVILSSNIGCAPYSTLKTALIEHYELNHVAKLNQLLHGITLQSMERPSNLLHRMKNLIGLDGKFSEDLLKKLFLDRMLANVRLILAANYELNLHDLAVKADSIFMFSNSENVYVRPNTNYSDFRPTSDFDYERANSSVLIQTYVNSNLQSQINSMADE